MGKRERLREVILRFQMIRRPFAFFFKKGNKQSLWLVVTFEHGDESLVLEGKLSLPEWMSKCDYILEECWVDGNFETIELVRDNVNVLNRVKFKSIEKLLSYLEDKNTNPDDYIVSIWR